MPALISALRQTSEERVNVVLDDGTEIKATLGVVAELRLYVGRALEEEELRRLRASSSLALARNRGLELLSYRPMSCKELQDKLSQKGESPEDAAAAVDWLRERGFLDDGRYAGQVVRHYAGKGYGEGRIRQELYRRGIPRELWDDAFAEMPQADDKLDRFLSARLQDPSDRAQVKKVSAALLRRGYSWEEIRAALVRYRAEIEEES